MNTAPRRALLLAALAAMRVKTDAPELAILHAWLDSWSGLGLVVVGMQRHGYDLTLTHDRSGWRATFLHRRERQQTIGPGPAGPAETHRANPKEGPEPPRCDAPSLHPTRNAGSNKISGSHCLDRPNQLAVETLPTSARGPGSRGTSPSR